MMDVSMIDIEPSINQDNVTHRHLGDEERLDGILPRDGIRYI